MQCQTFLGFFSQAILSKIRCLTPNFNISTGLLPVAGNACDDYVGSELDHCCRREVRNVLCDRLAGLSLHAETRLFNSVLVPVPYLPNTFCTISKVKIILKASARILLTISSQAQKTRG